MQLTDRPIDPRPARRCTARGARRPRPIDRRIKQSVGRAIRPDRARASHCTRHVPIHTDARHIARCTRTCVCLRMSGPCMRARGPGTTRSTYLYVSARRSASTPKRGRDRQGLGRGTENNPQPNGGARAGHGSKGTAAEPRRRSRGRRRRWWWWTGGTV
jgi:hypothetical protein